MAHGDRGHYAKKHPSDRKADQKIVDAVKGQTTNDEISCAAAFSIVSDLSVPPDEVGFTIDFLEKTLVKCQLGLYGYRPDMKIIKPADSVSQALEELIRKALVNDRLSCAAAWEIAEELGLRKMEVSSACEALKIKITPCQLGAF
jgi:hypothetical protein